jgi:cobalt-zinc-cadmium efflux system protein
VGQRLIAFGTHHRVLRQHHWLSSSRIEERSPGRKYGGVANGGPDFLLTRISTRAATDLERYKRAAIFWPLVDVFLLVPAVVAAAAAVVLGPTGAVEPRIAVAAAVIAAVLAGFSLAFDVPGRSRRAQVAAIYLESFVAETAELTESDDGVVDVRRWFVRINAAIAMGSLDVDPEVLRPPRETDGDVGSVDASVEDSAAPPTGHRRAGRHSSTPNVRAAQRAGARHLHRLWWAFLLAVVFLVIEAGAAFVTNSLSLLSDAGHVLADGVGLGMALAAVHMASRGTRHPSRTFGMYRLEIVAALANAVILVGVAGYVLVEAVQRMGHPPKVPGGVVLVVAVAGLAANVASFWLLRPGAAESLNVRAAYLDVVADGIASIGVLIGGVAIRLTGWTWIDPAVGAAIGVWILPRAWTLGREAFRVLVQAAPPEVDMATVEADLRSLPGVEGVHRLHLWTLTSDLEVASAHLIVRPDADLHEVLDQAQVLLQDRYRVSHTTLQLEADDEACVDLDW